MKIGGNVKLPAGGWGVLKNYAIHEKKDGTLYAKCSVQYFDTETQTYHEIAMTSDEICFKCPWCDGTGLVLKPSGK